MILEICTSNFQSAANAQKAGAHRIELCSELAVGGVTASYGLIKQVRDNLQIPVFALIRPRGGNFTYSEAEFEIMKYDIQVCKELGCEGIVSGILHIDNMVDIERTKELVALAKPMSFTFHRAFDWTPNPFDALKILLNLKVDRILTSGQDLSAEKGVLMLQQLKELANEKLIILPGSGINSTNILIFKGGGFKEVHCSAVVLPEVKATAPIPMNSPKLLNDGQEMASDIVQISLMLKLINE